MGVVACGRVSVVVASAMSRECSLCKATLSLGQFPHARSRRCQQCKATTNRIHRRACEHGYRTAYKLSAEKDDDLQHLMNAFVNNPNFTFTNYYGNFCSDAQIAARAARPDRVVARGGRDGRAEDLPPPPASPPPSPPAGSPPSSSSGQNAWGPIRVRVSIDASGPFSVTLVGERRQ